jgi:hypothetical protein
MTREIIRASMAMPPALKDGSACDPRWCRAATFSRGALGEGLVSAS